ncbi:MAG: STAS domain-containing protein [Burkholderiales bacterium]|nr:STAS domain-containing protein [Burkholderiales bacterium]
MQLTASTRSAAVIVAPVGRIDHAGTEAFATALKPYLDRCRAGADALIIDMGGVDYISSVGLRALMVAAKQVETQAGRIALAALSPMVREVFEISRFDLLFTIYGSVDEALGDQGGRS